MTWTPLFQRRVRWTCPNCQIRATSTEGHAVRTHFHPCRGVGGLLAPMVEEGADVKVYAVEREDYLGREIQRTDEHGRPYSAVVTERADGSNDAAVFAPLAQAAAD